MVRFKLAHWRDGKGRGQTLFRARPANFRPRFLVQGETNLRVDVGSRPDDLRVSLPPRPGAVRCPGRRHLPPPVV